ncbi:MAG: hypothetical protein MZV64_64465 [Ignavibacteriales bacterium]|nr:hypothetical protein [Ignavibacteriales bacterium]
MEARPKRARLASGHGDDEVVLPWRPALSDLERRAPGVRTWVTSRAHDALGQRAGPPSARRWPP